MHSLQLLHKELGDLNLEPDVQAVFLSCFLADEGYFGCSGEELDAAATDFLKRTGCPPGVWLAFLATAVDEFCMREDHVRSRFEAYISAQAAEFRAATVPTATATPAAPVVVAFQITSTEGQRIAQLLVSRTQRESLGTVYLNWEAPVPGQPEQRVQVQLVNCEGGPALIGYRHGGGRILEATRPCYSLADGLTFSKSQPVVQVRFDLR